MGGLTVTLKAIAYLMAWGRLKSHKTICLDLILLPLVLSLLILMSYQCRFF